MTINHIFDTSIYPEELKIAKVIPIYKRGRKDLVGKVQTDFYTTDDLESYGVFFLSALRNDIHPDRFAFVPKSGTEIATVNLIHEICINIDKLLIVSAIFIDLKNAFNMVK